MKTFKFIFLSTICAILSGCGPGLCVEGACGGSLTADTSSHAFGARSFNHSSPKTITLTNSSSAALTGVGAGNLSNGFGFYGGAFPGQGGTCNETITAGESCTIVVSYDAPFPAADHTGTVEVQYNENSSTKSLSFALTGSSNKGQYARATGFSEHVLSLTFTPSGMVAGGYFRAFDKQAAPYLLKFDSSYQVDTSFSATPSSGVTAVTYDPVSGDVYIGGFFSTYNGSANIRSIARINLDGTRDTGFNIGAGATAGLNSQPSEMKMAADGSGALYLAGSFSLYRNVTASRLARILPNGNLDPAFVMGTGFNGSTSTVLPMADGTVYFGGSFSAYNATPDVRSIVRLLSNGSIDGSFNIGVGASAGFNSSVSALELAPDATGDIYALGGFSSYNGTAVTQLARLSSTGTLVGSFSVGTGFNVGPYAMVATTDGSGDIYVGGSFSSYNGTAIKSIARLSSTGALVSSFDPGGGLSGGQVVKMYIAPDSSKDLLVVGAFGSYKNQPAGRVVRIDSAGNRVTSFSSISGATMGFDAGLSTFSTAGDGTSDIYVSGSFTAYDGTAVAPIVRLTTGGYLDPFFQPGLGANVSEIAPASDGTGAIYIANMTSYDGTTVGRIARVKRDGSLDTTFSAGTGFDSIVSDMKVVPDGSGDIYVTGFFQAYNGTNNVRRICRLNRDGSLDTTFNIGAGASAGLGSIGYAVLPQTDGSVIVGGQFTSYNGTTNRNYIVKLTATGAIDPSFSTGVSGTPGFNSSVEALAQASNGDIYVGGHFTSYDGTADIRGVTRLNSNGSVDTGFYVGSGVNAGTSGVYALDIAQDGSNDLYIAGSFTQYNNTPNINRIARINSDGSLDTGFNTGAGFLDYQNYSVFATPDGNSVFTNTWSPVYNYKTSNNLLRISIDGSMD